jgi:succinoglycan biosynthesis transport protein ExoP
LPTRGYAAGGAARPPAPEGYGNGADATPRLAGLIRRRAWSFVAGFASVLLATLAVTILSPRTYQSDATFLIEQETTTSGAPALDVLARMGQVAGRQTEMELIKSRRVLTPVVKDLRLQVHAELNGDSVAVDSAFLAASVDDPLVPGIFSISSAASGEFIVRDLRESADNLRTSGGSEISLGGALVVPRPLDPGEELRVEIVPAAQANAELAKRLTVEELQRDADLIRLTCDGRSPRDAQRICAEVSNQYLLLKSELQKAEASAAAGFLAEQTEQVERRLAVAEDSLRSYRERTKSVALEERAVAQVRESANLWAQREQLRAESAAINSLIERVDGGTGDTERFRDLASFPTFLTQQNPLIPNLVETLVVLETQKSTLGVRRSENDDEMRAISARIAQIERQLRSIAQGYAVSLEAQISSLEDALANSGAALATIPGGQVETARLERQVDLLSELYSFLQLRLREAEVAEAIELPSVRIVDEASLPYRPHSPRFGLNMLLGSVVAAGFGMFVALWRERSDTRFHERGVVEEETGIPVLTMLPRLRLGRPFRLPSGDSKNGDSRRAVGVPRDTDAALAFEAFRTLEHELRLAGRALPSGEMRSIAITSSQRGEGKTFTASNLAIVRASLGSRVLLIDLDLRGRGTSRLFGLGDHTPGLAELAAGEADLDRVCQRVDLAGSRAIDVLPAGGRNLVARTDLSDSFLIRLIGDAAKDWDLIIVDTPPVGIITDASVLASLVDGVVVVVRSGVTDREGLELTLDRLGRARARTAGIVFNGASLSQYHGRYGYA